MNAYPHWQYCHQTSDIKCILEGNKIVDHSDAIESIAWWSCSNYIFILELTPGFNGLGKDNCKTRWETILKDLVHFMLEVGWHFDTV